MGFLGSVPKSINEKWSKTIDIPDLTKLTFLLCVFLFCTSMFSPVYCYISEICYLHGTPCLFVRLVPDIVIFVSGEIVKTTENVANIGIWQISWKI